MSYTDSFACCSAMLLAKDVVRMQPTADMPACMHQAPLWHLHALCNILGVGLHTTRVDGVQPAEWPAKANSDVYLKLHYDGEHYAMA